VEKIHHTWSFGNDATVLDDYALTTTICVVSIAPKSAQKSQKVILIIIHWLPVHIRIHFKVAALTYKVTSTQQPVYTHNVSTSYHQSGRLFVPLANSFCTFPGWKLNLDVVLSALVYSTSLELSYTYTAIRVSPSLDSFKRHLKTHYFAHFPRHNTHHLATLVCLWFNCFNSGALPSRLEDTRTLK